MTISNAVTKGVLTNPIELQIDDENLGFETAGLIADKKAMEMASEPMLLGWYDADTSRYSPNVECCSENKPGWVVYAEERGGDITITVHEMRVWPLGAGLQEQASNHLKLRW